MSAEKLLPSPESYSFVEDEETQHWSKDQSHFLSKSSLWRQPILIIICILSLLSAAIFGFLLGRYADVSSSRALLEPLGDDTQLWNLNTSFSGPPSPERELVWESVIPKGRGFVRHDITDGRVGNIAVFHQIHCVHEIRVAYYTALAQLHPDDPNNIDGHLSEFMKDLSKEDGLRHVAHCFDYLRRVLMCAADTNIEYADADGLFTGWNQEKKCRNYASVYNFAEEYRTDDRSEIQ